jgi:DNA-binding NarL/FixJ family response regulator
MERSMRMASGERNPKPTHGSSGEDLREVTGLRYSPSSCSHLNYQERLTAARSLIGGEAFAAAWAEGKAMSSEEAIEYALETEKPASRTADILTPREREIATLVARGITNRQIAREFSISERTVATHIGRVFKKLGISSRNQVAARLAEQRTPPPDTS